MGRGAIMLDAAKRRVDRSPPLSFLNYSKGQVLHRLGLRRHRSGSTHLELTVEQSVEYAQRVVADYLHYAGNRTGNLEGAQILEVGPGDSLAVALCLIGKGARFVACVDRFEPLRDEEKNGRIYKQLLGDANPRERERIDEVLSWSEGCAVIDPRRIDCRYGLAIEDAPTVFAGKRFDIILSRAVLEHVFDLDATWRAMVEMLKDDGEMWHKVDFRNHGLFAAVDPLYYLTMGDLAWRLATSPDPTLNRERLPSYRRLARATGLDLEVFITHVLDNEELRPHPLALEYGADYGKNELAVLSAARPKLDARFRDMDDLDLLINGVFLICRRTPTVMQTAGMKPRATSMPSEPRSRPVRIAFVVHVMQVAGAEMLVQQTIERSGAAIDPTIFCLDDIGQLGDRLLEQGIPVVCLERRPGLDWGLPWRLAREIRRRRIELVHAQQYTPFFYAALARALGGGSTRLLMTEHGRHYPDRVSARRRWANRLLLSHIANRVTACCDFSRHALIQRDGFTPSQVEVVANGIEIARYGRPPDRQALRRRLGLAPKRRYVVAVGRLHPVKDHATLLRSFAQLCRWRNDTELLIVGDGPLRNALKALANELKIEDRVRFLGIRHDVPDILNAGDIFAQTSLSEAASLTLLEAMAAELPVVVTNVGGNPEIVRQRVEGYLVPRGDWLATARAMSNLLDKPERAAALGRAGRERVEECFLLDDTVERYLSIYRAMLEPLARQETK